MRLIYHPDAEAELIESARFYEQRVPSLGAQFLDAAELAIGAILDAPERWSILEAGVRRYQMPRFPFAVYYRLWLKSESRAHADQVNLKQCKCQLKEKSARKVQGAPKTIGAFLMYKSFITKKCAPRDSNPEPID